ncbi:MAG: hypothetical protein CVU32_01055 [Betaproteobacteria bacterium HGW-Betaproteobacteria-5]|jgi:amino acid permease|nr:MAG: hypothetical protein CVU32_01055 [Betaproteobacteria bacterium HGW-Betaproteobacteria-5]PKO30659.1 MAG: hypothetical protein CVU34_19220 [Betaproteobacteria bacterium HGW-Betaproteobacteria-7]
MLAYREILAIEGFLAHAGAVSCGGRRTPEGGRFYWSMPVIGIYGHIRMLQLLLSSAFYIEGDEVNVPITHRLRSHAVTAQNYREVDGGRNAV